MPIATEKTWPFKHLLNENSILSLLSLQKEIRVAILFDLGTQYLAINNTVELLDIDYNISTIGNTKYKWLLFNKSGWSKLDDFLQDIQNITDSLVIRVSV